MELLRIETKIYEIRGIKVMLDYDLAELYQVETKVLNQTVKRNIKRFPSDFMFQLTKLEWDSLRSQIVTLEISIKSQNEIIESKKGKYPKYLPYAFTEQGLAMLSGILNSDVAIEVNISIMRAFVTLRQMALTHSDLTAKIKEMESQFNKQFKDVFEAINYLLKKDEETEEQKKRRKIGFK
jgi:ORF6N domain